MSLVLQLVIGLIAIGLLCGFGGSRSSYLLPYSSGEGSHERTRRECRPKYRSDCGDTVMVEDRASLLKADRSPLTALLKVQELFHSRLSFSIARLIRRASLLLTRDARSGWPPTAF